MEASQARQLIDSYLDAYNCFEVEGMLACLHPEVIFENIEEGVVTLRIEGKDAFESRAAETLEWFMERIQHVTAFQFQDDRAVAEIWYSAMTAIELPNGVKPGTTFQLVGQSIFTFRDGLIASITDIS
jgi:hypothetical protein